MTYDSDWDKVSLLMHFDGDNGSTLFANEVSGLFATPNGNAQLSTTQKRFGLSSGFFDGSGDYLSIPHSTTLYDPGSEDYTLEMWTYCTQYNATTSSILCATYSYGYVEGGANNAGWFFGILPTNGYFAFGWGAGGSYIPIINTTVPLPLNIWCHVALCKVGNQYTIYLNGTSVGSNSNYSTPVTYPKTKLKIGAAMGDDGNHYYFYYGYIDELRITKGLARYTSNFTPATQKFPYPIPDRDWAKDVLLMHFNGTNGSTTFTDELRNVVTPYGNAQLSTSQYKFGGSSAYFDGTGDYLTIASPNYLDDLNGTFTVEFWMYCTDAGLNSNYPIIYSVENNGTRRYTFAMHSPTGSGGPFFVFLWNGAGSESLEVAASLAINTWHHIAFVGEGNKVVKLYYNGVYQASKTFTTTLNVDESVSHRIGTGVNIPDSYTGYIDEFRASTIARYTGSFTPPDREFYYPYAPYWESDVLLMHFNGDNNSTVFTEEHGLPITIYGNAKISTAQSKFGGAAGLFDGSGDYLSTYIRIMNFPGDFTIEFWVYLNAVASGYVPIIESRSAAAYQNNVVGFMDVSGTLRPDMVFSSGRLTGTTTALSLSTWTHIAWVRSGTTVSVFMNGVKDATTFTYSGTITPAGGTFYIAAIVDGIQLNGYLDELRISNGVARYSSNFVPPSKPYLIPAPFDQQVIDNEEFDYLGDTSTKNILSLDRTYYRELTPFNDDGVFSVEGTITVKGVPVSTEVFLFTLADKRLIATTTSNALGEYSFTNLKNQPYFVWARDETEVYNPVSRIAQNT